MKGLITPLRCLLFTLFIYCPVKEAFSQWTQSTSLTGGSWVSDIIEFGGDMYVTIDGAGIYRSIDDGGTWQKLSVPGQGNFVHFVHHNSELLAISYGKLFRTSNGNVWSEEDAPEQFIEDVSSDGTNIFAATSQGLFKSTDAGATWVKNSDPSTDVSFASVVVNGPTILAGISYPNTGAVLKSVDGGSTWTTLVINANSAVRDLYFQGTDLYANVHYKGVYKSTDNGANWQLIRAVPNDSKLLVTPTSLYSLDTRKVSVSTNGGISWTENNPATPEYFGVLLYATNSHLFVGSVGGGVFKNNVSVTESWETVNTGLLCFDINDIEIVNNSILLGTEHSFIRTSNDEGNTWEQLLGSYGTPSSDTRVLLSSGSDLFYGDGGGAGIFRSSDNGASWARKNDGIGNQVVAALAKTNTALVLGTDTDPEKGVYISVNRGDTWTKKSNGVTAGVRTLYFDGINLYAGTWSGLFKSGNNGESWTRISAGLPDESIGHIVSIGSILYAATQFHGLFKTSNGGADWELINNKYIFNLAVRKNVLFMASLDDKFFMSLDSGKTWSDKTVGLPNARVTAINFTETNLVVGSAKSGVWLRPLTQLLSPAISFYSDFPDSTFKIGQPVFVASDQELRKGDGSTITSSDLPDFVIVKNSKGDNVQFEATIDDKKKLITVIITSALENEAYTISVDPFKNVSGLMSPAINSYPFTAVLNHVPSLDAIVVSSASDDVVVFPETLFTSSFSDLDGEHLEKIMIKSLPLHGTLKLGSTPVSINDEITVESIGNLTYTPDEGFDGNDHWTWNGSDGKAYGSHDATVTIEVRAVTGIPEMSRHDLRIYPNPISETATIDFENNLREAGTVHLVDLTGREIKKINFTGETTSFDFSDVSKGVYILKLNIQGRDFQQKVIKL